LAKRANFELYHYDKHDNYDICTYTRYVLVGLLVVLILLFGFAVISAAVIHIVMGIAFSIYFDAFLMTEVGVIGLLTSMVLVVCFAFGYAKHLYDEYKWKRTYRKSEPGFISVVYKSWKDRFCTRVTFVDDENDKA
jgi:membrane-bound ClpP family serine protease